MSPKLYIQEGSLAYPNLSGLQWTLLLILSLEAPDGPSLAVQSSMCVTEPKNLVLKS